MSNHYLRKIDLFLGGGPIQWPWGRFNKYFTSYGSNNLATMPNDMPSGYHTKACIKQAQYVLRLILTFTSVWNTGETGDMYAKVEQHVFRETTFGKL